MFDQGNDVGGQAGSLADHLEPDPVAMQISDLVAQIEAQQPHEIPDLGFRAAPVLGRKAEKGQVRNPHVGRGLDDFPRDLRARADVRRSGEDPSLWPNARCRP